MVVRVKSTKILSPFLFKKATYFFSNEKLCDYFSSSSQSSPVTCVFFSATVERKKIGKRNCNSPKTERQDPLGGQMLLKFLRMRFQVDAFLLMLVKDPALRACKAPIFSHYFCRTNCSCSTRPHNFTDKHLVLFSKDQFYWSAAAVNCGIISWDDPAKLQGSVAFPWPAGETECTPQHLQELEKCLKNTAEILLP